ncbi:MAG: ATP-binding protein, partial [Marinifilaceae bacterium]|nr:ATP-binding protein [Marinifilaceae bacterium]
MALDHINEQITDGTIRERILNSFHRSTSLFSDRNQMLLPELKLDFLTDTKKAAFFFFKNGIVKVTATGISLHNYGDFEQFIWEESIINHDFSFADDTILDKDSEFNKFLTDLTVVEDINHASNRLQSLKSAMGYLIHRHKDGKTNKAIILMDVFVDGYPNGGSGKTLLARSLAKVRVQSLLNGKIYDRKEWFSLSAIDLNSDIVLFDDVDKNFDFESIFNMMTSGLEVRIPRKGHFFIPHEKSPKVIISTNYAISGDSDSYRRRKFEFEVSATYNADYTPNERFGHMLFDDWSTTQWNYFYNTLLSCVKLYLSKGLLKSEPINIQFTKIVNDTSEDFVEYAEENFETG